MMKIRTFSILTVPTVLLAGCLLSACSMFDPGGQSKKVSDQWTEFGWNEEGTTYDAQGSQQAAVTIAEGNIFLDSSGDIDFARTSLTRVAIYVPVVNTELSGQAFGASNRQSDNIIRGLTAIVPLISMIQGTQQPAGIPLDEQQGSLLASMDQMLQDFGRRLEALELSPVTLSGNPSIPP